MPGCHIGCCRSVHSLDFTWRQRFEVIFAQEESECKWFCWCGWSNISRYYMFCKRENWRFYCSCCLILFLLSIVPIHSYFRFFYLMDKKSHVLIIILINLCDETFEQLYYVAWCLPALSIIIYYGAHTTLIFRVVVNKLHTTAYSTYIHTCIIQQIKLYISYWLEGGKQDTLTHIQHNLLLSCYLFYYAPFLSEQKNCKHYYYYYCNNKK